MVDGIWDLSSLYKSNEDFLKDLDKAKQLVFQLEKFRGELSKSDPQIILDYLNKDNELSLILEKLAVFSFCKQDEDGKNQQSVKNYNMINDFFSVANEKLAFAKTELSSIDEDMLNQLKKDPHFSDYDRMLNDIIRYKRHTLSEKDEQNMAAISSFSNTDDIFSMLSNVEMEHGSFTDENGKRIKLSPGNYNLCMNNPNQDIRKKVMENYVGEYKKLNGTFANLFLSHIKYQNFLAKSYGFNSVLEKKCYAEEVPESVMMTCIRNVSVKVDLLHKYFKLKKKIMGLKEFYVSDIGVEILNQEKVLISYEDAISGIGESLKVFGNDYTDVFNEAVNNGWIDAFPRKGKKSGGYTTGTYKEHPYILLNFDGTFEWASALTHEFGHAMHSYYSAKSQPYAKYDYTLFVAEIVSLTNEIIYNKYLLSKTNDNKTRMKLLAYFLQLFELNVFDSAMLAEFELYVHDSLWNGETLSSEDLNKKYVSLAAKYFGTDVKFNKNFETGWSRKSHLYRDYYLYKYAMGLSCACFVANRLLTDNTGEYLKKYKKFLSLGGSLDPISALKVAEIDVLDDNIYDYAFNMFEEYLSLLEKYTEDK